MKLLFYIVAFAVMGFAIYHLKFSEEGQRREAERQAREAAARKPHIIREADGCKVYAFKDQDRTHYFTRCPSNTSTETNWSESCGKNCTKNMSSTIETRNEPKPD